MSRSPVELETRPDTSALAQKMSVAGMARTGASWPRCGQILPSPPPFGRSILVAGAVTVAAMNASWWRRKLPTLLWLAAACFAIGAMIALA